MWPNEKRSDAMTAIEAAGPAVGGTDIRARARTVIGKLGLGRSGTRLGLGVVGLGLVIIGIGWNGAAGAGGEVNHVPVVQAQLPWLLSGGFLGLGVVVLGAAMMIANAYRETEARTAARLEALLETLERQGRAPAALAPGMAPGVTPRVPGGAPAGEATGDDPTLPGGIPVVRDDQVVVGTNSYHRPDCRLVRGRSDAEVASAAAAAGRGLSPCRVCNPPA
jgi:hypothetical protein